ncbi:hypothetical protein E2C01_005530 [Portunus trituberculatus]|uniref:Uncharacterized protein n=1 Tax=Portunus trituberculatus TaxID=210409 RepID=A0A5B7CTT3_PORTR|nr:hypothetical protein [Portunus trituberculatus]
MSFTSPNNDIITTSRHAKFPLRFTGKYLSFYAVLMLYAQACRVRWSPGGPSYPIFYFWPKKNYYFVNSCASLFSFKNRDPGVDFEGNIPKHHHKHTNTQKSYKCGF